MVALISWGIKVPVRSPRVEDQAGWSQALPSCLDCAPLGKRVKGHNSVAEVILVSYLFALTFAS